jgi:four helix bundle protein
MATLTRFEDLDAWKKARKLTHEVYRLTRRVRLARDFALCDQVRRAAVSAMSNIAEGFERSGTGEFIQSLAVAKGSLGELRSQLYVALDQSYIENEQFEQTRKTAEECSRLVAGLMNYLRRSGIRGGKYKA